MQTIIGITMSHDTHDLIRKGIEYSFIRKEYGERVKASGGQPIFLDSSIDPGIAVQMCDGIIISGGEDLHPSFYGETVHHTMGNIESKERTSWERRLIEKCDERGIRILGVCYGEQLLNVHYGGTLYQDIKEQCGSDMDHGTPGKSAMHKVTFEQDFLGYKAGDTITSASRHHQAVRDLAPGFSVVARTDDGIVEAIAGKGHFGVQWHAESDDSGELIYKKFVAACKIGSPGATVEELLAA